MKKSFLIVVLSIVLFKGFGQTNVNMSSNGNTSSCSGFFYDDKGPSTNYLDNLNYTHNFYSSGGKLFAFTVESFSLSTGDTLKFYNGANATGSLIAVMTGTINPTTVFKSQDDTVSFRFTSDASVNSSGWQMQYQCLNPSISFVDNTGINAGNSSDVTIKGLNTSFLLNSPNKTIRLINAIDTIDALSITTFSNDSMRASFYPNCTVSGGSYNLVTSGFGQGIVSLSNAVSVNKLNVIVDSINVLCFGGCNGSASATVNFGQAPFTYLWSPGFQTSQTISGLCTGVFDVTISDINGCVATDTFSITQPNLLDVVGYSTTICAGDNIALSNDVSGGVPPYTYSWSPGTGLSSTTDSNPVAGPLNTTTYSLTVTDANLCTIPPTTLTVTVDSVPVLNPITQQLNWCNGQITNSINFSSNVTGTTYSWENNNNSTGLTVDGTGNVPSFFGTNSGTTNEQSVITVTSTAGSCSGSPTTFTMTIFPSTQILTENLNGQTTCQNTPFSQIGITSAGPGANYQWYSNTSPSTTGGIPVAGAIGNNYTPLSSSSGTLYYYCIVSGTCGSVTSSVSGAFIVNPSTNITSQTTNSQTVCQNSAFSPLTVSATGNGLTYQWYSNGVPNNFGGTFLSGATGTSFTPPSNVVVNKYYYVVVTGACGSDTSSISGIIKVNPTTVLNNQSTLGQTACVGTSFAPISFTANGQNPTYQWYKNSVASNVGGVIISGATDTTYTPDATNPGTTYYYFVVSGNCGIATGNVSGAFVVNPSTSINTQSTNAQTACQNSSFSPLNISASGLSITYQWYKNSVANNFGGNVISGATGLSYTPPTTNPGVNYYYVVVSGTCGSDTSTISGAITVNPLTSITSQSMVGQTSCLNAGFSPISITANGLGLSYQWYSNSIPSPTGATLLSGATSNVYTPLSNAIGTKYYYVIASGTCSSDSSSASGAFIVEGPTTINAQSTNSQTVCQNGVFNPINVTASGSSLTYQWYKNSSASTLGGVSLPGQTSSSYTPDAAVSGTSYYYVVVSGTCSSDTSLVSGAFVVNSAPTVVSTIGDSICGSGVATLTAVPSAGSIDWYATPSGGSPITTSNNYVTPTLSANTTYYAQAVSAGCISTTRTAVVAEVVPIPTILTTTNDTLCDGGSGSLSASANFGQINWYTTASGGVSLTSGPSYITPFLSSNTTYYIDAVNNSCFSSPRIAVQAVVNSSPIITTTISDTLCNSGSAILQANASSGIINWYNNAIGGTLLFTGTTYTTSTISSTTQYYVEAVNLGCSSTPRTLVEAVVNPAPFISSITGAGVCISGSDTLFATANSGVINWYALPTGGSPLSSGNFFVTPTLNVSTTYYVEAIDNACLSLSRDPVTLTVSNGDTISSQSTAAQTVCLNAAFSPISITMSAPPVSYQWYSNTTASNVGGTLLPGATGFNYVPLSTTSGTTYYYCVVVGGCGNIVSNVSGSFLVKPLPLDTIVFGSNPTCEGTMNYLQSSQSGALSYSWSGPNGFTSTQTLPFINPVTPASAGVYSLTVVGANGCTASDTSTLVVRLLPIVNAGPDQTVCSGSSITLTATGALNYNWSGGVINNNPFVPTSSASYTVTGTGANGCSNTDVVAITVNQSPSSSVSANRLDFCENDSLFLSSTTNASSYSWGGPNGFASTQQNPVLAPLTALNSGIYTLYATSLNGCVDSTASVNITVSPFPVLNVSLNTDTICPGGFVSGSVTYSFADSILWNPGGINLDNVFLNPTSTTQYTVTAYNTLGGCMSNLTQFITVVAPPSISLTGTNVSCFGFSDGAVISNVSGSSGVINYSWNTGSTDANLNNLTAGTYDLTITDGNLCTATSNITISEPLAISITLVPNNVNCGQSTGSILSNVSNGTPPYIYLWSNGDRTLAADSLSPGQYKLEVVDANGCQGTELEDIVALNGPQISLSSIQNVSCNGLSNGSINIQVTGGLAPVNVLWSNGETSTTNSNLLAGVYDVDVTDASGCVANASFTVNEPTVIVVVDSVIQPSCGNSDGEVFLTASGGNPGGYTYQWSSNAGGGFASSVSNVSAGIYTVTVSDVNFCFTTEILSLSNPGNTIGIVLDSVLSSNCTATPAGSLYMTTAGNAQPLSHYWSNGGTTEDLTNAIPGSYSLMVTDTNQCVNSEELAIPSELAGYRPEICLVTVDDTIERNLVIWNKEYGRGIAKYRIYRQTSLQNFYLRVAEVPFDSLSIFKDSIANVDIRSWRYKISAVDSCGFETPKSDFQKTIHLVTRPDTANNKVELFWDYYDGLPFSKYYILREDIAGYTVIDSVLSNVLSYTDLNPPSIGVGYRIDAIVSQPCNPTLRIAGGNDNIYATIVKTRSNVKNNRVAGLVKHKQMNDWKVFPVPAQQEIFVELSDNKKGAIVELSNLMGQLIDTDNINVGEKRIRMDVSKLKPGIYFVRLKTEDGVSVQRAVIER